MKIQCPDCGVVVDSGDSPPGSQFACDNCGRPLTVPAGAPAAPSPAEVPAPEQPAPTVAPEAPAEEPPVFGAPPTPDAPRVFGGEEPEAEPSSAAVIEVEAEESFALPPDEDDEKAAREAAARRAASLVDLAEPEPAVAPPVMFMPEAPGAPREPSPYAPGVPKLGQPPTTGQPYPRGYVSQVVTGAVVPGPAAPSVGDLPSFGPGGPPGAQAAPYVPGPGQQPLSGPGLPPPAGFPPETVPASEQISGLNFGAFWFGPIWAACHGLWLWALLSLCTAGLVNIVLLFVGNQLAWGTGKFSDVEHFRRTQRGWSIAGLVVFVISLTLFVILPLIGMTIVSIPGLPGVKPAPQAQEDLLVPPEERGAARKARAADEGTGGDKAPDSGESGAAASPE